MANNRMILKCKGLEKSIVIAKNFGGLWTWRDYGINDFFKECSAKAQETDFCITYESLDDSDYKNEADRIEAADVFIDVIKNITKEDWNKLYGDAFLQYVEKTDDK